jgi:hypothetical protein
MQAINVSQASFVLIAGQNVAIRRPYVFLLSAVAIQIIYKTSGSLFLFLENAELRIQVSECVVLLAYRCFDLALVGTSKALLSNRSRHVMSQ